MTVALRRATPEDAELLARHRGAVWVEVGEWDAATMTRQVPVWTAYFRRAIADQIYVAFVATEGNDVIGSGAILVHASLPRPASDSDRAGRVQSVYVVPAARRRGIARDIMEGLLAYARERRLISLSLHPSDEARGLYESLGFATANEMRLDLVPE